MGVDTLIRVSTRAPLQYVAQSIALLLGEPGEWESNPRAFICKTVQAKPSCIAECATIEIQGKHNFLWHWELDGGKCHGIMASSRAENIALGKALVSIWGGEVVFKDTGDCPPDFSAPAPDWLNQWEDGDGWESMQNVLSEIKPLTRKDIVACQKFAEYKAEEE